MSDTKNESTVSINLQSAEQCRATRYATPRKLLRWDRTPHLEVLKMLAWVVKENEDPNVAELWEGVRMLCPEVMQDVLGEENITLERICAETLQQQGSPITPEKLMQRADKTERYDEQNGYAYLVVASYERLTSTPVVAEQAATAS